MIIDQLQFNRSESFFLFISDFFSISKMFLASFMAFELGVYMANVYDADCEKQMQSTNLHRD